MYRVRGTLALCFVLLEGRAREQRREGMTFEARQIANVGAEDQAQILGNHPRKLADHKELPDMFPNRTQSFGGNSDIRRVNQMLTTEMRQSLLSLLLHPDINSISITDFRGGYDNTLGTYVDLHVKTDAKREPILSLLRRVVNAKFVENGQQPLRDDGLQVSTYKLIIEGTVDFMSTIYFTETIEKLPVPAESMEKIELLNDSTVTWSLEDIMRNEG